MGEPTTAHGGGRASKEGRQAAEEEAGELEGGKRRKQRPRRQALDPGFPCSGRVRGDHGCSCSRTKDAIAGREVRRP